jgi:hypothetical protein
MQDITETPAPTPTTTPSAQPLVSEAEVQQIMNQVRQQQNLPMGLAAGFGAALVGAVLWAAVTALSGWQIGYMAIGVGFLVGFAIRNLGKGIDPLYGYLGAGFSLFGCVLGNLLMLCAAISKEYNTPLLEVTQSVLLNPSLIMSLLKDTFDVMDLLFYGLAVWAGYSYSFRKLSDLDLAHLKKEGALPSA